MKIIHRFEVPGLGVVFRGPSGPITFGFQESREKFSIWFEEGQSIEADYVVVGTGVKDAPGDFSLVASVVMPNGFHVFHLLRKQ